MSRLWTDEEWRAQMSTAEINDLPDSAFAFIEPGGEKDSEGKTTPRSLRHYPVHDEAHARNALSRAGAAIKAGGDAAAIAKKAMPKILAACKKFGIEVSSEQDAAAKQCPTCDGTGKIMDGHRKCPDCGGTGEMAQKAASDMDQCSRCQGDGTITNPSGGADIECPQCGGSGSGDNNAESKSRVFAQVRGTYGTDRLVAEKRLAPRSQFELREVPDGTGGTNLRFTGFASVTGEDAGYEMEDMLGPWTESISRGAFQKTLGEGADVAFLVNHEGMTLARTKSGTLKLSEETNPYLSPIAGVTGLHSEAMLDPQNPLVQGIRSAIERGDLDEMSFAFRVIRQEWAPDWSQRFINEVSLDKGDVSLVNYGANPHTGGTVALRQKLGVRDTGDENARLAFLARRLLSRLELRQGKVLSGANQDLLEAALQHMHIGDDVDIPAIVRSLQDINTALDAGQACLSAVLQVANPDGGPGDLQPTLTPDSEQKALQALIQSKNNADRLRIRKAKGEAA